MTMRQCVFVLTVPWGKNCDQIMRWFFQASVSDCSNSRLCCLLLCIPPIPSIFTNPLHSHHTGSSAHLGVPCLHLIIFDFHTRSFAQLGVTHIYPRIPITHPDFLSLMVVVILHAHLPTAPTPPLFTFSRVFQGVAKSFSHRLLGPAHLPNPPPSFIHCLPCTYLK